MLREARMADLRKLRRGIGHIGKGGSGQKNGVQAAVPRRKCAATPNTRSLLAHFFRCGQPSALAVRRYPHDPNRCAQHHGCTQSPEDFAAEREGVVIA